MNKLQNDDGIAVRGCTGRTIQDMKRDIAAALYHCCEFYTDGNDFSSANLYQYGYHLV